MGFQEICVDDPDWLSVCQLVLSIDVDEVIANLMDDLFHSKLACYHGCRTKDATQYLKNGIIANDPEELERRTRQLVLDEDRLKHLRPRIEEIISTFDARDRDTGRVYLSLDERGLIDRAGHYLIYGSEWMMCILGASGHEALRQYGVPTFIHAAIPLSTQSESDTEELAREMLQEWTRQKVNKPNSVRVLDFSLILRSTVPPEWVIGHSHPTKIPDWHYQGVMRHTEDPTCPACCKQ
jgi:hypothetical protein